MRLTAVGTNIPFASALCRLLPHEDIQHFRAFTVYLNRLMALWQEFVSLEVTSPSLASTLEALLRSQEDLKVIPKLTGPGAQKIVDLFNRVCNYSLVVNGFTSTLPHHVDAGNRLAANNGPVAEEGAACIVQIMWNIPAPSRRLRTWRRIGGNRGTNW